MGPQRKWRNMVGETEITTGQNSKMCLEENSQTIRGLRDREIALSLGNHGRLRLK